MMKKTCSSALLLLAGLLSIQAQAETQSATLGEIRMASAETGNVAAQKRELARILAKRYPVLAGELKEKINRYQLHLSTDELQALTSSERQMLQQADNRIRRSKGLSQQGPSLLQLRLADEAMLAAWQGGEEPLFAFAPEGNDKYWDVIEAFDSRGYVHLLDVNTLPDRPVLVVELDGKKALSEGLKVMRETFAKGHGGSVSQAVTTQSDAEAISTSVLKRIRLNDDQEPWISGAAEIYGITTGVDPSRLDPVLDIVEMPYLDYDGTDYYPNQIVIHWERYRWQAADLLLMEHDDGTNYKELASKLLEVATAVMRAIPDPEIQGYAIIPQLTNEILKAMPDAWFTNDDDYVDVFYTLMENQVYNQYYGASGNAKINLEPLTIAPR